MSKGDHIFVTSMLHGIPFQHHGIDMGDGTVVHLAPEKGNRVALSDDSGRFCVRRVSIENFADGKTIQIVRHENPRTVDEIVEFATLQIGRCGYHLLDNNCEHFASLCATGNASSRQIEISHCTAVSITSALTKGFWALTQRVAIGRATKLAASPHPLTLIADGAEAIALASGCAVGLSSQRTRQVARASGNLAAFVVGCAAAGPVGGAVSLALHRSSTEFAERLCTSVRRALVKSPSNEKPQS